jgi:hypothetical protein
MRCGVSALGFKNHLFLESELKNEMLNTTTLFLPVAGYGFKRAGR